MQRLWLDSKNSMGPLQYQGHLTIKVASYAVNEAPIRLSKDKKTIFVAVFLFHRKNRHVEHFFRHLVPDGLARCYHATDHPDADHRKYGRFTLGGGPILTRGPNVHPAVFEQVDGGFAKEKSKYSGRRPRPTVLMPGLFRCLKWRLTGLVGLRYMHTPRSDWFNDLKLLFGYLSHSHAPKGRNLSFPSHTSFIKPRVTLSRISSVPPLVFK